MGKGGSSQVVQYVPVETPAAAAEAQKEIITPAIAKSISGNTAKAQEAQQMERERSYGIGATYNRYKNRSGVQQGNDTLGGR